LDRKRSDAVVIAVAEIDVAISHVLPDEIPFVIMKRITRDLKIPKQLSC